MCNGMKIGVFPVTRFKSNQVIELAQGEFKLFFKFSSKNKNISRRKRFNCEFQQKKTDANA